MELLGMTKVVGALPAAFLNSPTRLLPLIPPPPPPRPIRAQRHAEHARAPFRSPTRAASKGRVAIAPAPARRAAGHRICLIRADGPTTPVRAQRAGRSERADGPAGEGRLKREEGRVQCGRGGRSGAGQIGVSGLPLTEVRAEPASRGRLGVSRGRLGVSRTIGAERGRPSEPALVPPNAPAAPADARLARPPLQLTTV